MCYKHHCFIIPPHILEGLAKRGSLACKQTLNDTRRILKKRQDCLNNLLMRSVVQAGGQRSVYDCGNKYEQRLRLARREGDKAVADQSVNAAYDGSGFVRDYFSKTFGLDSIDNQGMSVLSNVHYGVKYNNAYWDGDEMTYGDGDGEEFKDFASAIDVVAHEITHGITQFLANLEYYGQPGALNEHFSDVFGTIIKQKHLGQKPGEADWLIGDLVVTDKFPGKAIRSLKAPGTANEFDVQPAHMDKYYAGSADNQGVHINSGIPNKAFYLSVMAIGMEGASKIWFGCLQALWRTASFQDMLEVVLKVTSELSDKGEVGTAAVQSIRESFKSVGLKSEVV